MEGPPLGPGGEDITWPDQVAPRGRKASSTRQIKPQTSNRVLHLAWRTKDHKIWSQDHGPTWAVRGAHIRRGFEGKVGMYMGMGLWSISSMNSRLRIHACSEPSDKW